MNWKLGVCQQADLHINICKVLFDDWEKDSEGARIMSKEDKLAIGLISRELPWQVRNAAGPETKRCPVTKDVL